MSQETELPRYTWDEVAIHNTPESLWVVLDGNVYDVTGFAEEHPGGKEILQDNAGKDATMTFEDVGHSTEARELRKNYLIGVVDDTRRPPKKRCSFPKCGWVLPVVAVGVVIVGVIVAYKLYKK